MPEQFERASILLVDDNPKNLLALEATLEPLGHRLVSVRSGEEALRYLLKEEFALILMDVRMPDMDGFQTVAMIKQRQSTVDIPVIFVSALAREAQDISTGYKYGAIDYLVKPFDPDLLRAKVSVLVALHLQARRIAAQREELAQRRMELKLQEALRANADRELRMKDQFLAMISHELRNPLNAIIGWTELLGKFDFDEERVRRAMATIQRSAQAQKRLVDDLIDLSAMVVGNFRLQMGLVDLAQVARAAMEAALPAAEKKKIHFEAEIKEMDPVPGDAARIEQIVTNLLSNAFKFVAEGGAVTVRVRRVGEHAELEVADNGAGIAAEDLPRVFERFWQGNRPATTECAGLGLGLAIADQLARLHGGELSARSEGPKLGSTFTLRLPLAEPAQRRKGA